MKLIPEIHDFGISEMNFSVLILFALFEGKKGEFFAEKWNRLQGFLYRYSRERTSLYQMQMVNWKIVFWDCAFWCWQLKWRNKEQK